jgi:hypothetical protein
MAGESAADHPVDVGAGEQVLGMTASKVSVGPVIHSTYKSRHSPARRGGRPSAVGWNGAALRPRSYHERTVSPGGRAQIAESGSNIVTAAMLPASDNIDLGLVVRIIDRGGRFGERGQRHHVFDHDGASAGHDAMAAQRSQIP